MSITPCDFWDRTRRPGFKELTLLLFTLSIFASLQASRYNLPHPKLSHVPLKRGPNGLNLKKNLDLPMSMQFQGIFISFLGGVFGVVRCLVAITHMLHICYGIFTFLPTCTININQMQVNIPYMGAYWVSKMLALALSHVWAPICFSGSIWSKGSKS